MRMSDPVTVKETSDTMRGLEMEESPPAPSSEDGPAPSSEDGPAKIDSRKRDTPPQPEPDRDESCCQDKNDTQVKT